MAKKTTNKKSAARWLDYFALRRELKAEGPARLYLLFGEEDYLRESFLGELRAACLPEGDDGFAYHRFDAAQPGVRAVAEAVNALPFTTERTLVELRGFDLNHCRDAEAEELIKLVADIPDYCTVAIVLDAGVEPDMRLKAVKAVAAAGKAACFTPQGQGQLTNWIQKRFAALGKRIGPEACMELVFTSGELMNGLIPEIAKLASGTEGEEVTAADVRRLASPIPEAQAFKLADCLAARDFNGAARLLSELLASDTEPITALAAIGGNMRRLYAARVAIDEGLGREFVEKLYNIRYSRITDELMSAARRLTRAYLARAVELCAETDYRMKSSPAGDRELLAELLIRLSAA